MTVAGVGGGPGGPGEVRWWCGWCWVAGLLVLSGGDGGKVGAEEPGAVAPDRVAPDMATVGADLAPRLVGAQGEAGSRFRETLPAYRGTRVYHVVYRPLEWRAGGRYPVLIEYSGNGPYRNRFGDVSTGRPEDSQLGYGLSGGRRFLWVCLPFLNEQGTDIATQWWGDRPNYDPEPTLDYCRQAVPWICEQHGGDPSRVVLIGFSRGAIACNFIGLHDDRTAGLWRGFVAYSHYDGVFEGWGYPGADRGSAARRLERLGNRRQLVLHELSGDPRRSLEATRRYLEAAGKSDQVRCLPTGFRNHSDRWTLRPSPARREARRWLAELVGEPLEEGE